MKLEYQQRDYGYYLSHQHGHATIMVLLGTYYVIAVVHGETYSAEFKNAEDTHEALQALYTNSPRAYTNFKTSRRGTTWYAKVYRWVYRFLRC